MPHATQRRDADGVYYVGRWIDQKGRRRQTAEFYTARDALDEAREFETADRAQNAGDGQR